MLGDGQLSELGQHGIVAMMAGVIGYLFRLLQTHETRERNQLIKQHSKEIETLRSDMTVQKEETRKCNEHREKLQQEVNQCNVQIALLGGSAQSNPSEHE
ncbi:hypothetical protein Mal15_22140 [Stieleria maiorica]|uniref:Uncharacterized protein n=1 Tax=Stieleria maiorica TaxID=2795974 RepID=A0A5B9MD50_9BACT|nr:hypothetical protein [Stieleria maiorica]QEF98166.1 hypothetical protein Mal15_22140 [Stieleria maiorica]